MSALNFFNIYVQTQALFIILTTRMLKFLTEMFLFRTSVKNSMVTLLHSLNCEN